MPAMPACAAFAYSSIGKLSSSSHSAPCGAMCASANLRAVARISACSSVSNRYATAAEHTVLGSDMPLRRSRHLSWFAHMGAVYLFHDLYGYLMEMSPDVAEAIEAGTIEEHVDVLKAHAVLVDE